MCFIYIRTLLYFVWLINSHGENILNEMVFVLNPILSEKKSSVKFKVRIIMSLCVLAKYRIPKCLLSPLMCFNGFFKNIGDNIF